MISPVDNFTENMDEVLQLLRIHKEKVGSNRGRKHGVGVLNKSSIVLLMACWEAFVEDTASSAFEFILKNSETANQLPLTIKKQIAKYVKDNPNEIFVWNLADSGWKLILDTYKDEIIKKYIGPFHSPKAGNVDDLFNSLIGLSKMSSCWHWTGMSYDRAKKKLQKLIELRGSIAHRVKTSTPVLKADVNDYGIFALYLAICTSNGIREYVYQTIGVYPWSKSPKPNEF